MWRFWCRKPIGRNYDDGIHRYAEYYIFRFRIAIGYAYSHAYTKSYADSEQCAATSVWSHCDREHPEPARMADLRWMRE
jgi:hypothetical protein